ncbi:hypothetical protein [Pseudomonas putida]|uniref:hypothetical protein n=1 Tax=Pseudomonas putida TaxID=303 RepID=UPI0033061177
MKGRLLLSLGAICVATGVHAADERKSTQGMWHQEPASFIGIQINQNLTYQLNQCPADSVPDRLCYKKAFENYYTLRAVPPLGLHGYSASVLTHDSQIREITLTTKIADYQVKDLLVRKYGKPHLQGTEIVKTKVGATFQNEKLFWEGKSVAILLEKYSDTIDKSSVSVINTAVAVKAKQVERGKLLDSASQL